MQVTKLWNDASDNAEFWSEILQMIKMLSDFFNMEICKWWKWEVIMQMIMNLENICKWWKCELRYKWQFKSWPLKIYVNHNEMWSDASDKIAKW